MRLPPLKALLAFSTVAKTLNITQAAEQLFVTQSAVSQQLKLLQEYLEVELIKRDGNQLFLTPIGQQYADRLANAFAEIHDVTQKIVHDCRHEVIITVNCMTTFASQWLVPRLSNFLFQHPGIELRISTPVKIVNFEDDEIDAAIYVGDIDLPEHTVVKLWDDYLFPVCHPSIAHLSPEELLSQYPIYLVKAPYRETDWPRWLQLANLPGIENYKTQLFPTVDLTLASAKHHPGIAMGHGLFVAGDLARGDLVRPFPEELQIPVTYHLVCPSDAYACKKQTLFREWLLSHKP